MVSKVTGLAQEIIDTLEMEYGSIIIKVKEGKAVYLEKTDSMILN